MDKPKAEGLLKLKLNGIMTPFHYYGMDTFVPEAISAMVQAAYEFHENLKLMEKGEQ